MFGFKILSAVLNGEEGASGSYNAQRPLWKYHLLFFVALLIWLPVGESALATKSVALVAADETDRIYPGTAAKAPALERYSRWIGSGADESVCVTGEHPYYVINRSCFVPVRELEVGDVLRSADGAAIPFNGKRRIQSANGKPFLVHNFAVADHHTYFAGEGGVWVHNLCKAALDRYAATHKKILDEALESGASPADALDEALEGIIRKSQADELDEIEMDEVLAYVYDQLPDDALASQTVGQWDEIMDAKSARLGNFNRGNAADDVRDIYYRTQGGSSQIYIEKPVGDGHFILDNYIPGQEIVSRKDTDFIDTITDGLLEMGDKYDVGRIIKDTPHNRKQLGDAAVGQPLSGQMILEIPPRLNTSPLPEGVKVMADNLNIIIRDYSGKVLN